MQVDNLLLPNITSTLGLKPGVVTKPVPTGCKAKVAALLSSLASLSRCNRISANETEDVKIMEDSLNSVSKSLQGLIEISDGQTVIYLGAIKSKFDQFKEKLEESKIILRLIFKGEATEAARMTEKQDDHEDLAKRVVTDGYYSVNATFLKSLVTYAGEFTTYHLSIQIYEEIVDLMQKNRQLITFEMLQVWFSMQEELNDEEFINAPAELKTKYAQLAKKLSSSKESVEKVMIADLEKGNVTQFQLLGKVFEHEVYDFFMPEITQLYFKSSDWGKVKKMLKVIDSLPYWTLECSSIEMVYNELKNRDQIASFEAFALGQHANYVIENSSPKFHWQCLPVASALNVHTERHLVGYILLFNERNWTAIYDLHQSYIKGMRQVLPLVVERLLVAGGESTVSRIQEWIVKLPRSDDRCVALESLISRTKANFSSSYESLVTFSLLKHSLTKAIQKIPTRKCESAKARSPNWIRQLLWGETSKCDITSRKSNEQLVISQDQNEIEAGVGNSTFSLSTTRAANQRWTIEVQTNGLTTFKYLQNSELYLIQKNGLPSAGKDDASSKRAWYLDFVEDGFYQISSASGKDKLYLTSEQNSCQKNYGCVWLNTKNSDHSAQWKIAC